MSDIKHSRHRAAKHVLVLALGGGGDAVSAAILAESLSRRGLIPVIAGLAWERYVKDPNPGPRRPGDLCEIKMVTNVLGEVTAHTAFPNGAYINQAILTSQFGIQHSFVLDPYGGTRSIIAGLMFLDSMFNFHEVWGVDVGGDILAEESMDSLRSPLADALMLAALYELWRDASVAIVGIGVDGELPRDIWEKIVAQHFQAEYVKDVLILSYSEIRKAASLFDRRALDSEATAIVVRAYCGLRGNVLIRDAGSIVKVDFSTLPVMVYRAEDIYTRINMLPKVLSKSTSLEQASRIVEEHGYLSELRYEQDKANSILKPYSVVAQNELLPKVLHLLDHSDAYGSEIHLVSERFVAEKLKVDIACVREVIDNLHKDGRVQSLPPFIRIRELSCVASRTVTCS